MDSELKDRSLKLLADPHKLKETKVSFVKYDHFKYQLECKFSCSIDQPQYEMLVLTIQNELIIYSVVDDIIQGVINQVDLYHSP